MHLSALLAAILELLTVYRGHYTVDARHVRRHPHGPVGRGRELEGQLRGGALRARVELEALTALMIDESALNHAALSPLGAFGAAQLMPGSRWARGYRTAVAGLGEAEAEGVNILWGAYALRAGLEACGGSLAHAFGHYRTGHCRVGPRARHTLALAAWLRARVRGEERGRT